MGTVVQENARMACQAGISATVYTPYYAHMRADAPREEGDSECRVERLTPLFSYGNAGFTPSLFWKLCRADIIHLHYPALGMELPVLFWTLLGKKLVVTYHMDLVGRGVRMRMFFRAYSKIFLPLIVWRSSCIFVTSFDYANVSPLLAPAIKKSPERFSELPCSVDMEKFRPSTCVDISTQVPFVLFVGALDSAHYSKGVPVLLQACSRFGGNFSLVLIGEGDLRSAYEEQATVLGIADHVFFAGSVAHDDLLRWYARARCLVLPSTDTTEAFGIVIIEAGACGVPSIATRLPGVRSVIDDGVTGFLVEPNSVSELAEKIQFILSHPERARAMGDAARKRVEEKYSYEAVKKRYTHFLYTNT